MTLEQVKTRIAAVCATMQETGSPVPESSVYVGLGCDYTGWQTVKHVMIGAGLLATAGAHQVSLTPAGEELGRQYNEALDQIRASRTA